MRLLEVFTVSTPKTTGMPVSQLDVLQPAGAFARDVLEMRRVAADDAAERDDRVVLAAHGERARSHGQLERARHARDQQALRRAAMLAPRGDGARR